MVRFDSGARSGQEVVVVGEGRGVAELAEKERDLSPVISGVVEGVMEELAESVGGGVEGARRVQLGLYEVAQIAHIRFVVRGPCALQSREVSIVIRRSAGDKISSLKEAEPAALAPKDVDERALEGDEAGAEIAFPLLGSKGGGGFEEALVGPSIVVGLGLDLVGVHIPGEM